MSLIVQKFGGSSVRDAQRIRNVAGIIAETYLEGNDVLVVLSAQGDTTDDLIAKAEEINSHPSKREMDMLLATGEQISVALCAMALESMGLPCVSLTAWQVGIQTTAVHGDARIKRIDSERVQAELDQHRIVLITGFQGMDRAGDVTTLGRGGSDTSAVALAAAFRQLVLKQPRRTVDSRREIERLDAEFHFDAVCAVCAPYRTAFALEAAAIRGKKFLWQLDPYASNRDYTAPGGFAREGQLLDALDGTFVTPQALPDYADGAPLAPWREKVHVLGFPTLLPRVIEPVEHDDIQCVFCGSLHPGMREPGFALALFRALHDDAVTLTMAGGGWERFAADADETARVLGAKFVRPGLLPPDEAAALENRADVLVSLGNTYDNQMPSKLFGFFATGKPVLHLAVSENDPTLPYLARYPLALVLHRKDGVTPGTVAKLHSWLHNVQGHALPFAQTARLYPEFTPEKVAEEFLKWL